jgi:hypothetical protein
MTVSFRQGDFVEGQDRDRSTQRGAVGNELVADQAFPHYVFDATLSTEDSRKACNVSAPNCSSWSVLMREKKATAEAERDDVAH